MRARRPSLAAAGALVCAAVALWVSFGALTFVEADTRGLYLGILPPVSRLVLLLAIAGVLALVVRPAPRVVAPLWLSAAALLPWLPLPLPLSVFMWTDHVLLWLWAAIAAALLVPHLGRLLRLVGPVLTSPVRSTVLAGLFSLTAFGLGASAVSPAHPDGDEPHYLIITQSIIRDRDLKIENNHRQGDYEPYFRGTLRPDFQRRGRNGEIYSIHAPGLPFLLALPFALFGYQGAVAGLALFSALGGALAWLLAWRMTGDAAASWFGWAAAALSVPFFFHASSVFPDAPAAVLFTFALLPLVDSRAREPRRLLATGAALAMLPWLHSRFAILAVAAGSVAAARLLSEPSDRLRRLVSLAACPALGATAFFLFFQTIYGTPDPTVVYNGVTGTAFRNIVRGAPGLLFDQQFGLIATAPVYVCAFGGVAALLRVGRRRLALELLAVTLPYSCVAGFYEMWWAGTTPPARFLVPLTLIAAVPIGVWFATSGPVARAAGLWALLVSLLMTATMALVDRGAFVFNFRDGMSRVAVWLTPVVDLTRALPSLFQNPPVIAVLQTAVWGAAAVAAVVVTVPCARRRGAPAIVVLGLALQVTTMAAVGIVWRSNDATAAKPFAAGAAVLRRFDVNANQIAVSYRPFGRLERTDLLGRIVLARAFATGSDEASVPAAQLPAGTYEVRGTVVGAADGRVLVKTDPLSGPVAAWEAASLGSSWSRQVTLPIAVAGLRLELDAAARTSVRDVSLKAISIAAPERGFENREARQGARYGPALVFLLGGSAWVEPGGIWVAGAASAEFVIAPDPGTRLRLLVRNGAVMNNVTLESGPWLQQLTLAPGEELLIPVPSEGRRLTPLGVTATIGYRPADVDPKSEDRRYLGVWIETR